MKLLTNLSCLIIAGLMTNIATAQTKDPELNKCIQYYTQIEQDLETLAAKLTTKQQETVSARRIKAVNAFQAIRPRTLASCRTYQGTIGTIKMDIQNKRI